MIALKEVRCILQPSAKRIVTPIPSIILKLAYVTPNQQMLTQYNMLYKTKNKSIHINDWKKANLSQILLESITPMKIYLTSFMVVFYQPIISMVRYVVECLTHLVI